MRRLDDAAKDRDRLNDSAEKLRQHLTPPAVLDINHKIDDANEKFSLLQQAVNDRSSILELLAAPLKSF